MDRLLVLVRHGQSEWNLKNLFTGWENPDLTELGVEEACKAGRRLKELGLKFDVGFTSNLWRAQRTMKLILGEIGQPDIPVVRNQALNERDYGKLTGLNKDEAAEQMGHEQVHMWRRSYDIAPPGGESLRDTLARTLPFYVRDILPEVMAGKHTIVSAHGNSLRALLMVLENLSPDQIQARELATGVPIIYRIGDDTRVTEKRDLTEAAAREMPTPP